MESKLELNKLIWQRLGWHISPTGAMHGKLCLYGPDGTSYKLGFSEDKLWEWARASLAAFQDYAGSIDASYTLFTEHAIIKTTEGGWWIERRMLDGGGSEHGYRTIVWPIGHNVDPLADSGEWDSQMYADCYAWLRWK